MPEETIPQYIQRVKEQTPETLRGYATRAHSARNHKLHRALLALIKQKNAEIQDTAFTQFIAQLQANKAARQAEAARPPKKGSSTEIDTLIQSHLRDIRKAFILTSRGWNSGGSVGRLSSFWK